MSKKSFPRFVWVVHPTREGVVKPEIWHSRERTNGRAIKGGFEIVPNVAQHEITIDDACGEFSLLIERFPPPEGFKASK